ncbi:hypothetical protein Holit_01125 [Hollandina sp. SP2]
MKKALRMGGATLLAFALIFSACDNGTTKIEEDIPSLSKPENLAVVNEHEGVITVTWNPNLDAMKYEVWRKEGADGAMVHAGDVARDGMASVPHRVFRFDDIISATNQLKTGVDYTYTVIAVSSTSTTTPRGVEVIQNGVAEYTITQDKITKIPAQGAYTVSKVANLAAARVTLPDGSKELQISWDKNPNPGVSYKGQFNGNSFEVTNVNNSLSPDGTKVVYTYNQGNNLTDGEQYKAEVTAYYKAGYYKAAEPAESPAYTHLGGIITNLEVNPVTLYANGSANGSYNVSVSWIQNKKAPADVTYELYRHEGSGFQDSNVVWEAVTGVTIPKPDSLGFIQVTLTGTNVPAYRKAWTYKVVAKAGGEEVGSETESLNSTAWSSSSTIRMDTYNNPLTLDTDGKKIRVEVEQVMSGLYSGDSIEFYAVQEDIYNSTNQTTSSDTYLSQYTLIGEITKADLESSDSAKRTKTSSSNFSGGEYAVIAVLKNGDTRNKISSLYNASFNSWSNWTVTVHN